MLLWALLTLSSHAADFDSLKWSKAIHPSFKASISGPVPDDFHEFTTENKEPLNQHRQKRLIHGQDILTKAAVPKYLVRIGYHAQVFFVRFLTSCRFLVFFILYSKIIHQVRIVRANRGSETKLTWCTGTIIKPGFVLTAAWCVFDQPDKKWRKSVIPFSELQIIAGDYDMRKTEDSEQIREPIQYHIHPRYKYSPVRNNLEFDFAIIQLKTDFTYSNRC